VPRPRVAKLEIESDPETLAALDFETVPFAPCGN
jgi:hypothetical protein